MTSELFEDHQGDSFGRALACTEALRDTRKHFEKHGPRRPRQPRVKGRQGTWSAHLKPAKDARLEQAAEIYWPPPPKPFENTKAENHFLEALVTAPDNRLAWDAVRVVGMLRNQVEALREDVRRAPSVYEAARKHAASLVVEKDLSSPAFSGRD
eukprot:CAMPEP_0169066986 /NCGR_PEP_ID=MMETSP1015-20121227/3250_1 /TAXON_ID=342587 /ORGANISM="Karlodinium micrum, Strain CCMP2283" /LENGTH=153 /DNA_ID=CAMNT_0009125705 /DNA_START=154 /DNA_END=612 /DNA_ORIENTATION=-